MAPSIPTHRPLLTATRVVASIAIASSVSSVYLALGTPAWAGNAAGSAEAVAGCVASASRHASNSQAGPQTPERGTE